MSGKNIDKKLNNAYKKIGNKLGYDFKLYRSVDYLDPVQDKNYVKTIKLAATIDDNFKKNEEFSFKVYQMFCDGFDIQPGDIFVSDEIGKKYTLVQNETITVPVGIDSSSVITVSRPEYNSTGGFSPKTVVIADKIPCKILEAKSQSNSGNISEKTPYKTGIQQWDMWFYLDKPVKVNDILEDGAGNRSTVQSAQITPLGWKIMAVSTKS